MHNTRKHFLLSLVDQCAVSGANFLTIALGAAFLPIGEQGKLVYTYTAYIALVLFNVSAFFSTANIVRNEVNADDRYRYLLLSAQMFSAPLSSVMLLLGLIVFQGALQWQVTAQETALLLAFLIFQQFADFYRRSGYVFGWIGRSAGQSMWLYGTRIAAILYFRPESLSGFLLAMSLPALPPALRGVTEFIRDRGDYGDANRDIARFHQGLSKWNVYGAPLRWAGLHLPILLVGALHSLEAAAILGTLRAITTFANVLLEMLETFVPAWLSARLQKGEKALRSGSLALLGIGALLWFGGAAAIALFGEALVLYVLGAQYAEYTLILHIVWLGNGIYFASRAVGLHYRMKQNSRLEFLGLAIGVGALLLSIPLIPLYGAWGGAWCLNIVQIATLASLLVYRLRYRISGRQQGRTE